MPESEGFNQGVALVVGGSGGIGSAICETLAERGSNIAFTYRSNGARAEQLAARIRDLGVACEYDCLDLEDAAATRAVVAKLRGAFGTIHYAVYAAGPPLAFRYINEITPEEWARVNAADVNGFFNFVAATLPVLREQEGGNYVALVTGAVDRAPPRDILSAAPKAAIQMLVRGIAREEGRSGIRANCVGPGYIEAGLGLSAIEEHSAAYVERMIKAIPLQRAGTAREVANVVAFLLSDEARYVTGATIPVAGGLQLA